MTCDAGVDFIGTLICMSGQCTACLPDDDVMPRFVDNRDGTITDLKTCLVWEKKDDAGGIHDKGNAYTWSSTCSDGYCPPDGTAFTVFLAALNAEGFAGHRDWRLPTSAGREEAPTGDAPELDSLIDLTVPGCGDNIAAEDEICIDPIFLTNCSFYDGNPGCTIDQCSCTPNQYVWSYSEAFALETPEPGTVAWAVWFKLGLKAAFRKWSDDVRVRAVRGGVVFIP